VPNFLSIQHYVYSKNTIFFGPKLNLTQPNKTHIQSDANHTKDWPFKKETTLAFGQFTTISGHFLPTT
jgi:hypothetical protein